MFDEHTYELIDGYLNNTLDSKDRVKFEGRLENDPELLQEFMIQQNLFNTLEEESWAFEDNPNAEDINEITSYLASSEAKNVADAIAQANKEYQTAQKQSYRIPRWLYPIAASVLLLIGYFFFFENTMTTAELYAEYQNWDNLPSLIARADADATAHLAQGQADFKSKKYQEASEVFSKYLQTETNPQVSTYLGIAYIELEQYSLALETFDKLLKSNSLDSSKAFWYKALVYLKMDDKAKTLETLNLLLQKESNYNYRLAKELKAKLLRVSS